MGGSAFKVESLSELVKLKIDMTFTLLSIPQIRNLAAQITVFLCS